MPRGKRKSVFGFERHLTKMIDTLKAQRAKHADALASIDGLVARIGINTHLAETEEKPRRGRPPGKRGPGRPPKAESTGTAARKGRTGRGRFATSGSESILT